MGGMARYIILKYIINYKLNIEKLLTGCTAILVADISLVWSVGCSSDTDLLNELVEWLGMKKIKSIINLEYTAVLYYDIVV